MSTVSRPNGRSSARHLRFVPVAERTTRQTALPRRLRPRLRGFLGNSPRASRRTTIARGLNTIAYPFTGGEHATRRTYTHRNQPNVSMALDSKTMQIP